MSDRTPELTTLCVFVLLVVGAFALGGKQDGSGDASAGETVSPERLARVERRVEELRGLRFRRPVRVEVLSPAEVREFGMEETEKETSRAETQADEEVLKLLGLIDPSVSLDAVFSSIYGEQVAGLYDPRSERLVLVEGVGVDDVTLAHELTHALEDQHFDLERFDGGERDGVTDDDAAAGESGLVEGTATVLMTRYLQRYPGALTFGDALGQLLDAGGGRPLPPYVMRSLLFPYQQGERFVTALMGTSGDWRLVDTALRHRPPVSTAELYDADRWLRAERPVAVPAPDGDALGAGWERLLTSTLGEFDLRELLRAGVGDDAANALAGGWTGGRYALWRRGPLDVEGCPAPCARRDAFALSLRLDSPAAAGAVGAALGTWLRRDRDATAVGAGAGPLTRWRLPAGDSTTGGAIATRGREVRLVLAPDVPLAVRLTR